MRTLFDVRDSFGCTALHYASREGIMVAIEKLLSLGAKVTIANHAKVIVCFFSVVGRSVLVPGSRCCRTVPLCCRSRRYISPRDTEDTKLV